MLDLQIELALATERVAAAQEAYNAAVPATKVSTATTNKLIREYNAMLRGGASNDLLRNKLLEVQAAQRQLQLDRQREIAAQAELDAAEAALEPIKEMVKLQEQLIDQLIDLAKAQADAAKATEDIGSGAADAIEQSLDDIASELTGSFFPKDLENWFLRLKEEAIYELSTLWTDLKVQWTASF